MQQYETYLEIDTKLFFQNLKIFRDHIGVDKKICLVLKSNAYGHGLFDMAQLAVSAGIDYLSVATVDEGIRLRSHDIQIPILVLVPCLKKNIHRLFEYDLTTVLTHLEFLDEILLCSKRFNKPLKIHVKIDTGMHRLGFSTEVVLDVLMQLHSFDGIIIEGIYTHFASSGSQNVMYQQKTKAQCQKFTHIVENVRSIYPDQSFIFHSANSGSIFDYPGSYFNMVRLGLGAYGYPAHVLPNVMPVMTLKSHVVDIKQISKGEAVSYNGTWVAPKDTCIALIPVGYGDGVPRYLSNQGQVKICNKYYPIVGSICMNLMIIDIGDAEISLETEVMIFGNDNCLNAESIANQIGTISHEILTNLKCCLPRIYK